MKVQLFKRLQEAMSIRGIRQVDLVEKTGLSKSKINMYVNGEHSPKHDAVYLLAKALGVQEAWLMGYDVPMEREKNRIDDISDSEIGFVVKYRTLDDHGKKVVDYVLDEEYVRSTSMQESIVYMDDPTMKIYPYLGAVAAAGSAVYPGDIPIEQIKARKLNGADFIVGVSGDSMEPEFYDGDRVYVKKTADLEFRDIGLFIVNGYYYIKELAPDGLRSKNPKWSTVPKDRDIIVVGKVLGKVEE